MYSKVQKLATLYTAYRIVLFHIFKCYQGISFFKNWCAMDCLFLHRIVFILNSKSPTFLHAYIIMWLFYLFSNSLCHHTFLPSFSKCEISNSALGSFSFSNVLQDFIISSDPLYHLSKRIPLFYLKSNYVSFKENKHLLFLTCDLWHRHTSLNAVIIKVYLTHFWV